MVSNEQTSHSPGRSPSLYRGTDDIEAIARIAVDRLGIADAICREADREGADSLFTRIEECDTFAEAVPVSSDMMFLALSLPIANGLIYFATNGERLRRARDWAMKNWPEQDDPITMLATLTLIYIVESGWRRFESVPEKAAIWSRINGRVEKLKQDSLSLPPPEAA